MSLMLVHYISVKNRRELHLAEAEIFSKPYTSPRIIIILLTATSTHLQLPLRSDSLFAPIHVLMSNIIGICIGFVAGVSAILLARWRQRLANILDQAAIRQVSRFHRRYHKFVQAGSRYVDQKGLTTVGFYTPELDDVFVDVSLTRKAPQDVPTSILDELSPSEAERLALGALLKDKEPMVLAVVGGPGSGKTTLLRYTARHIRRRRRHRNVPILLYLRDHSSTIVRQPNTNIVDLIRNAIGDLEKKEPKGWFEQKLGSGDCIVLLDGLDEVSRQEDRRNIADWIERQVRQYPANHFVISSRPLGYLTAPVEGVRVLQVRSFTTEQAERFVYRWYQTTERNSTPNADLTELLSRANSAAADLLQRINATQALSDLTVNPLLLTMIANVHRFRGFLPGTRADLYREICEVMLSRRQESKKLVSELNGSAKLALISNLAYSMMRRQVPDFSREEVTAQIMSRLRRVSRKVTVEGFIEDVCQNGLLVERETRQYSFAHHTLQEYLAATHIQAKGLVAGLAETVDDPWWSETALLYAAHADADAIVTACLDSGSVTALSLALECINQPVNLAPFLQDRLNGLVASAFEPKTEANRRQLITKALLTKHLRQRLRIAESSITWTRPITANLYWLFLQDTENKAVKDEIPNWDDETLALGMRGNNALSFVRWVNQTIGSVRGYRLPKTNELDDATFRRLLKTDIHGKPTQCVWTISNSSPQVTELCVSPGSFHPYSIDTKTVIRHLEADIVRAVPALISLVMLRSAVAARLLARYLARSANSKNSQAIELANNLARHLASNSEAYLNIRDIRKLVRQLHQKLGSDRKFTGLQRLRRLLSIIYVLLGLRGHDLTTEVLKILDQDLAFVNSLSNVRDRAESAQEDGRPSIGHFLGLDQIRSTILDSDPKFDLALSIDRSNSLSSSSDVNRITQNILPLAIMSTLSRSAEQQEWVQVFSNHFFNVTCIVQSPKTFALEQTYNPELPPTGITSDIVDIDKIVYTDGLGKELHSAVESLYNAGRTGQASRESANASKTSAPLLWRTQAGDRLLQYAVAVLDGVTPATPESAACIRLVSLCLAAEAQEVGNAAAASSFRRIAAGVTVLERRTSGKVPISEVVVLIPE